MAKEKDLKKFVEKIDNLKKVNPKDLSSDQDLSIAVMNLISIEEHLVFTGAKTGKNSYYDIINEVREMRKTWMQKLIEHYEGEVWCISKHLLASSMRLMEVGTKQLSMGNAEESYKLFNNAYDLYCLFWGLNMGAVNLNDVKWSDMGVDVKDIEKRVANVSSADSKKPEGILGKLKDTVKKAVNCCIE